MSFLLNRDPCVAFLRNSPRLVNRFARRRGSLVVSAATVMSLELWLLRVNTPVNLSFGYRAMTQLVAVANIDEAIAHRAASIGSNLYAQGRRPNTVEFLVAGTAVERGLTLVTRNGTPYANIPGLTVVDWLAP